MRVLVAVLASLILAVTGCGYSSNYMSNSGGGGAGAPAISGLVPGTAMAGGGAFVLTVNGSGFGTDAVVYWGMTPQTSTYVTNKQVTAQIPAADIASAGTVSIYVRSNGKNSNSVNFSVQ